VALRGAIAAAATPLRDGGQRLDDDSFGPLVAFLAAGGLDGLLACGTTGEGMLLSVDERRHALERFLDARPEGFQVAAHVGAQTTHQTVTLAAHAAQSGADAVAVIAPPYYLLDETELLDHLLAAANACAPVPFYAYEFVKRSGYAIPVAVIERLRERAPNLRGLKVSDTPLSAVEPYLAIEGLELFVGSEPLALAGMAGGALGSVSGLATAWPGVVATLVHERSEDAGRRVVQLRDALAGMPFQAALKAVLVHRGVLLHDDVRPPLRTLTDEERAIAVALADEG